MIPSTAPRSALLALLVSLPALGQTRDYVADGVFTSGIEGPAVDAKGRLYAVNFGQTGTIGRIDGAHRAELFLKLPAGSTGNGIRIDGKGFLYVADHTGHSILKIDPRTRAVSVLAHSDQLTQPNDLALARNGRIYASDPNWKTGTGRLWRIDPDGTLTMLEADMGSTNGIEVSPDERHLYVNESMQQRVWRYDLDPATGAISGKQLLITFPNFGLDGMRCDQRGNLHITRYGAGEIAVVSPVGEVIQTVLLKGKKPSNVAFGGKDGRTVYVTLQDRGAIETYTSAHPGREWALVNGR